MGAVTDRRLVDALLADGTAQLSFDFIPPIPVASP